MFSSSSAPLMRLTDWHRRIDDESVVMDSNDPAFKDLEQIVIFPDHPHARLSPAASWESDWTYYYPPSLHMQGRVPSGKTSSSTEEEECAFSSMSEASEEEEDDDETTGGAWSTEDSSSSHDPEDTGGEDAIDLQTLRNTVSAMRTSAKARAQPKPKKKKKGSHARDPHHGKLRGFFG